MNEFMQNVAENHIGIIAFLVVVIILLCVEYHQLDVENIVLKGKIKK